MFKLLEKNKRLKIFTSIFIIFGSVFFFPGEITATPEKPVNSSPANGALDQSLTPTLTSSTYANNAAPDETYISSLSPQLWLDASDTSTLFNATAGGSLPAYGSAVARWEDKSSNAYHVTQGTSNSRPTRRFYPGGKSVVRFDGANDFLNNESPAFLFRGISGTTMYAAVDKKAGGSTQMVLSSALQNAGTYHVMLGYNGSGTFRSGGRRLSSDTSQNVTAPGGINDQLNIVTANLNYSVAQGSLWINKLIGVDSAEFQTAGDTDGGTVTQRLRIGAGLDTNGVWFLNADILEVIVFHTTHDATTRDDVWNYLNNKWNVFTVATHSASQWQITSTSGDYSSPVYDSGEDGTNLESINVPGATLSENTVYYWRVRYKDSEDGWSEWSDETSFETLENVGSLSVGIVDSADDPVVVPSVSMSSAEFSFADQTVSGVFGDTDEKIRVENGTATDTWTVSLAPDEGSTALWEDVFSSYDFNDPTADAGDGADTDSFGGQMTVDPSSATITPQGGCGLTSISTGGLASFSEGVVDSITIASATSGADTNCYWDITDVDISQTIPGEQPAGSYSIDMTLSIIAS